MELGPDERLHKSLVGKSCQGWRRSTSSENGRPLNARLHSRRLNGMKWNGGFEVEPLHSPWLAAGQAALQLPTLPAHAPNNCEEVFLVIICSGSWSQGQQKPCARVSAVCPAGRSRYGSMAAGKTVLTPPPRNGRCRAHERSARSARQRACSLLAVVGDLPRVLPIKDSVLMRPQCRSLPV